MCISNNKLPEPDEQENIEGFNEFEDEEEYRDDAYDAYI